MTDEREAQIEALLGKLPEAQWRARYIDDGMGGDWDVDAANAVGERYSITEVMTEQAAKFTAEAPTIVRELLNDRKRLLGLVDAPKAAGQYKVDGLTGAGYNAREARELLAAVHSGLTAQTSGQNVFGLLWEASWRWTEEGGYQRNSCTIGIFSEWYTFSGGEWFLKGFFYEKGRYLGSIPKLEEIGR